MKLPINYNTSNWIQRRKAREAYIDVQNGLCHHCGISLEDLPKEQERKFSIKRSLFPPNFFKFPVHLHHNHNTGLTIGAVHCYCNAVLWQHFNE